MAASPSPEVLSAAPAFSLSPALLGGASLALALLILLIALFLRRKSASRGNALLVVGPPDAGKTALLSMLVYKQTLPTHTSMQMNSSTLLLDGRPPLTVIDVPGHPRIRDQFKDHLSNAKAVLFVVDSTTVSRTGPVVAEHLHHILNAITSLPPSHTAPALAILAHKSDLLKTGASGATSSEQLAINRVRTVLERELEKRRAAKSGAVGMESLGGADDDDDEAGAGLGGLECSGPSGGVFRFAEWEGGEVEFIGSYVKLWERLDVGDEKTGGGKGVQTLLDWLESLP